MKLYRLAAGVLPDGRPISWASQRPGDLILSVPDDGPARPVPVIRLWRVAAAGQGCVRLSLPEGEIDVSASLRLTSAAEWDRLFGVTGVAAQIRTHAEAEAYVKDHHENMGSVSANAEAQAWAAGLLQGFVLTGLLTAREAEIWKGRMSECPEDGLHGGGASWCNYCGDVCVHCGEPKGAKKHPTRRCVC